MGILKMLTGSLFDSVGTAIDKVVTSDEERLSLKNDLQKIVTDYETKLVEVKGKIIEAEAKSEHWLTSSWRPITLLTFTFIIASNYIISPYALALFDITIPTLPLTDKMWSLLEIGLGGYVVGRSLEKTMKHYKGK